MLGLRRRLIRYFGRVFQQISQIVVGVLFRHCVISSLSEPAEKRNILSAEQTLRQIKHLKTTMKEIKSEVWPGCSRMSRVYLIKQSTKQLMDILMLWTTEISRTRPEPRQQEWKREKIEFVSWLTNWTSIYSKEAKYDVSCKLVSN